jgi:exonuclease VII small subunit
MHVIMLLAVGTLGFQTHCFQFVLNVDRAISIKQFAVHRYSLSQTVAMPPRFAMPRRSRLGRLNPEICMRQSDRDNLFDSSREVEPEQDASPNTERLSEDEFVAGLAPDVAAIINKYKKGMQNATKYLENTTKNLENTTKNLENTTKYLENTTKVLEETRKDLKASRNEVQDEKNVVQDLKKVVQGLQMKGKINAYRLMTSRLPDFADATSDATDPSQSASRVDVRTVKEYAGFKAKQAEYTRSIRAEFENRSLINDIPIYTSSDSPAGSEQDIGFKVFATTFFALNGLLEDVSTTSIPKKERLPKADAVSRMKASDIPLVLYEFKRRNLITYGTDLAQSCNLKILDLKDRNSSRDPLYGIQQLVGYMVLASTWYGIMTNGEYYWALELEEDGSVLISEAYRFDTEGENSVLSMICYVIHLARELGASGIKRVPPNLQRVRDAVPASVAQGDVGESDDSAGASDAGSDGSKRAQMMVGFKTVRLLEEHPDRVTLQAEITFAGAESCLAAVKAFDTVEARNSEIRLYELLKPLHGIGIPKLLDGELKLKWTEPEEPRVHAHLTSWVGPPSGGGFGARRLTPPPASSLRRARAILEEMHKLGVAHGDVRLPNLSWDPMTGQVFVLDLSHGRAHGEDDFEYLCGADLRKMDRLIAEAEARRGPWARK